MEERQSPWSMLTMEDLTAGILLFLSGTLFIWLFKASIVEKLVGLTADASSEVRLARLVALVPVALTVLLSMLVYTMLLHRGYSKRGVYAPARRRDDFSGLDLSREQAQMIYDNSPVPYFLMDDEGVVRSPNKATLRFFGGTADTLGIINIYDRIIESDDEHRSVAMLRSKVVRRVPLSGEEVRIRTLKNNERVVLMSVYSLDIRSTLPYKHLVTLVDVTKERESEQVKTDFLLLASHQLRTPTTTIKWYVDYLLNTKNLNVDGMVREYLEEIYTGNERMIDLITTLLTVSRIELGMYTAEFAQVRLGEMLEDILKELETETRKKVQHIQLHLEGDDKITTDRTMLRIIVHNLFTNAIKYTPRKGDIRVEAAFRNNAWRLDVSDTGCGIPLEEQDKIFTKMYRATNARKIAVQGTGLGLYLTKSFSEKLGGTIEFDSIEGQGTTFSIKMPRVALGA